MKITKPTKLIASIVLVLIFAIGFYLFLSRGQEQVKVIGNLSAKDLAEIKSVVRQKLRKQWLPKMSWWHTVSHLGETIRIVRAYERVRIQRVEATKDGKVNVGIGEGKFTLYTFVLTKNDKWEIIGYIFF